MFVIVLSVYCTVCIVIRLLYIYMFAPVGKNGFADYCEGKLKINQSIDVIRLCQMIINSNTY